MHFAKTFDSIGPLGAKSMSESPYNPVAAALGNAIRDATGVRLYETPFMADQLYRAVLDRGEATSDRQSGQSPAPLPTSPRKRRGEATVGLGPVAEKPVRRSPGGHHGLAPSPRLFAGERGGEGPG